MNNVSVVRKARVVVAQYNMLPQKNDLKKCCFLRQKIVPNFTTYIILKCPKWGKNTAWISSKSKKKKIPPNLTRALILDKCICQLLHENKVKTIQSDNLIWTDTIYLKDYNVKSLSCLHTKSRM